jgi:uncharacterized protein (TIGR03437 family)
MGTTGSFITSVKTLGAASTSLPQISPNDWLEIDGTNLVPAGTTAIAALGSGDANSVGQMPTQLNGVSVTVNGKPAYVDYYCAAGTSPDCSTDRIYVLSPLDDASGIIITAIVVTGKSGVSSTFDVYLNAVSPSLLRAGSTRYVEATRANGSRVGPPSLYQGFSTLAKAGEVVLLWGAGFGLPKETLTPGSRTQSGTLPETPVCTVGGNPAKVSIALVGLGLYQLNLTVPPEVQSGDNPVSCIYRGAATPDGALLAVQ